MAKIDPRYERCSVLNEGGPAMWNNCNERIDDKPCEAERTLILRMDRHSWDVLHDEVFDWRDQSWASMDLPGDQTCKFSL